MRETNRLCEAYVIDVRFINNHNIPHVNCDLTRALSRDIKFQLSHLSGNYYLLLFNSHITHQDFMTICDRTLNSK
jgi:hypothetical protein